jgi:hypothetical protein
MLSIKKIGSQGEYSGLKDDWAVLLKKSKSDMVFLDFI